MELEKSVRMMERNVMAMEVNIISIISILIMFSILINIGISIMLDKNVIAMPCIIIYNGIMIIIMNNL